MTTDRAELRSILRRATARLCVVAALLLAASITSAAEAKPRCGGKKGTIVGSQGPDVLKGGSRHDVIVGRGGNDTIVGGRGRDTVCAGPGDDVIYAGGSSDRIRAGAGNDVLVGGYGSDRLVGEDGADIVLGGPGGELAEGGPGDDRLYGGLQDDGLIGGDGNDLLVGGQGSDQLEGEGGEDWLRGDTQGDFYDGGVGEDWISFAAATPRDEPEPDAVSLPENDGVSLQLFPGRVKGDDSPEELRGIENVVGSAFRDSLAGHYPPGPGGTVVGLANRDDRCEDFRVIECGTDPRGGSEAVAFVDPSVRDPGLIVLGNAGVDSWRISVTGADITISAGSELAAGPGCRAGEGEITCSAPAALGYLVAYGDAGDDAIAVEGAPPPGATVKLDGGRGNDQLEGGPGDEILEAGGPGSDGGPYAGADSDFLSGGGGDDALFSRPGADVLEGGPGADQLAADDPCGGHVFDGGPGASDVIGFDPVNPVLPRGRGSTSPGVIARIGGGVEFKKRGCGVASRVLASNEILEGSQADDVLIGDQGNDGLILGGEGNDVIKGRGGADRLRGELGSDRLLGGGGPDTLQAADGQKDRRLSCGRGGGRAITDSKDPRPRGCNKR